ncbi:MAG TPA: transposase [Geminicoccaceae bacterium]|nr:transposase [Geminicoccaceae bacterium]
MAPLPSDLDTRSLDELKRLVARLLARMAALEEENRQLREENARLKALPKRPKLAPGGMDRASGPDQSAKARRRGRKRRGSGRTPPVTEERILTVAVPPGSRRKGYLPYTVQDLVLALRVIRYRRERWVAPDGREIVAPLPPEVTGHFGPGVMRFLLMQHVQGQVTTERLLAQLRALGIRIAKGQIIALLSAHKDGFHAEKDAILEAGLATARWVTVDDTGARHAGRNETTTHIGDDRFAWFATRPSKSRLNFLELLRAGHPDYVINAAAAAYMLEHGVPEPVITALLAHERRTFADEVRWGAHLDDLGLGAGCRRLVTEAALVGAIAARGLLTETVIVSDDAGQFDVLSHALCWVHAERHLRRVVCATAEQQRLLDLQRQLVWWFYRDLKLYKGDPDPTRRAALKQRFDRVFGRVTGFAELDDVLARLRANKAELLLVLDRPEIPLHTNGSENDLRSVVTKRKISGETRSAAGKRARDTFLSLLKTCAKLAVSFWAYLGARLKIPEAEAVPWLPDLIRQRAPA